jgi:hypothetical protein
VAVRAAEVDFREGRIETFSDWLTAPENPMFARVAVNRLWQWHFGEGCKRIPATSARSEGRPAIRSCSIGWPPNLRTAKFSMKEWIASW